MERFFDVKTGQAVDQIELRQGETRILGLAKFTVGDVAVRTGNFGTAYVDHVIKLNDATKKSYDKHYNLHEVAGDTKPLVIKDAYFFQVGGNNPGSTELTARFTKSASNAAYASTVTIKVTENKKYLGLQSAKPFDILWRNHPYNPVNAAQYQFRDKKGGIHEDPGHPCHQSTWLEGQCMIRFVQMLIKSGVGLRGLQGENCRLGGKEHQNHFINPYDFERWQGTSQAYVWETKGLHQPEPMPGIAAYYFTLNRRGVILFKDYFPVAVSAKRKEMRGGHIDLWNRNRMGNTYSYEDPATGLSAFARAKKIIFWPLEPV